MKPIVTPNARYNVARSDGWLVGLVIYAVVTIANLRILDAYPTIRRKRQPIPALS
ncbi:hypothetical protein KX816_05355 [Sphingosinicellaceae bacterium]|nr:hypothetical protein KX816_05355 [Sphingosinicellaceae bacterium]